MADNSEPMTDLFGDVVPRNFGGRGRPEHMPTSENINKVRMLLALGWGNGRIAKAMSITQPTLRKHYKFHLRFRDEMRDRMEASYGIRLWAQVQEGNVGAMRLWAQFVERNDRMGAEEAMGANVPAPLDNIERPGKKLIAEQRASDADAALMAELDQEAATADNAPIVH
jgi:hypothetical protein